MNAHTATKHNGIKRKIIPPNTSLPPPRLLPTTLPLNFPNMLFSVVSCLLATSLALEVTDMRVEWLDGEDLFTDEKNPRLSWVVEGGERGEGVDNATYTIYDGVSGDVLYSSPPVTGNPGAGMVKCGLDLDPGRRYAWSVTISGGVESSRQYFGTGLMGEDGWDGAEWLGGGVGENEFVGMHSIANVEEYVDFTCYVAGLGSFAVWVDGVRLGSDRVHAHVTEWRNETVYWGFPCRITSSPVRVAVLLGKWWYALENDYWYNPPFPNPFGQIKFRMVIVGHKQDGASVVVARSSSSSCRSNQGLLVADDLATGEVQDATKETVNWTSATFTPPSSWSTCSPLPAPSPTLSLSRLPPITSSPLPPITPTYHQPQHTYVVDLGIEIAGTCEVTIPTTCPHNHTISFLHGEYQFPNGTVAQSPSVPNRREGAGRLVEVSAFTCSSDPASTHTYRPFFTYTAFRYLQISNWPSASPPSPITCYFQSTNLSTPRTRSVSTPTCPFSQGFGSSEPTLDAIYCASVSTALHNAQFIPTDTASREKRGWSGDSLAASPFLGVAFDTRAFYAQWLRTIRFSSSLYTPQGAASGINPSVFVGGLTGVETDPAWGSVTSVLYDFAWRYGEDTQLLRDHFSAAKAYVDLLLASATPDTLLNASFAGTRYGDWCADEAGDNTTSDPTQAAHVSSLLTSYHFIAGLDAVARAATALNLPNVSSTYASLASTARASFHKAFFHPSSNLYFDPYFPTKTQLGMHNAPPPYQTSTALALDIGAVPSHLTTVVAQALANDIAHTHKLHPNVGVIGASVLYPTLARFGQQSTALASSNLTTMPSFGYMALTQNTLWERWDVVLPNDTYTKSGTMGHIMLGGSTSWLIEGLLGIKPRDRNALFPLSSMMIAPYLSVEVSHVHGSRPTPRGVVYVSFDDPTPTGVANLTISLPPGFAHTPTELLLTTEAPLTHPTLLLHSPPTPTPIVVFQNNTFFPTPGITSCSLSNSSLSLNLTSGMFQFTLT